ncbi:MAG: SpoIVB peptidase [Bacillota bacterium]|nr:SpoIVB peptidase [Bacillota bacterium]
MNKKRIRNIGCIFASIILSFTVVFFNAKQIPDTIFVRAGDAIQDNFFIKFTDSNESFNVSNLGCNKQFDQKVNVNLLGIFKVKTVDMKTIPSDIMLYPGGQPVGVKLNTKGVLIVALSDIETQSGKVASPAANSGLQIGDSIISINNQSINSAEELVSVINSSQGKESEILIERKGEKIQRKVQPVKCSLDNNYKIGLWVRDSTAGVGTLTFYDANSKKFAALGHPITDVDTGTILSVNYGQIVKSSIISVKKGIKGTPGELKGIFVDEDNMVGQIYTNTECGIFGKSNIPLKNDVINKPLKIALRNEIKEGNAKILTTIDGESPKLYNIQIQKLLSQNEPGPKSMIIKITDPILLEKTGGIVQGMSGSPIIQNDKIVGAVTHVLINKPDQGYGIYIEWMIKDLEASGK